MLSNLPNERCLKECVDKQNAECFYTSENLILSKIDGNKWSEEKVKKPKRGRKFVGCCAPGSAVKISA